MAGFNFNFKMIKVQQFSFSGAGKPFYAKLQINFTISTQVNKCLLLIKTQKFKWLIHAPPHKLNNFLFSFVVCYSALAEMYRVIVSSGE